MRVKLCTLHLIANCDHRSKTSFPNNQKNLRNVQKKGGPYCIFAKYVHDSKWYSSNFWKKKLRKWKSWKLKVKGLSYAFNSELCPLFKDKFPQQSKKFETNENIEKEGKGDHITSLRISFTVQSNIPPTFEKIWEKNVKTKNKEVNTGSELRGPFKVKFSLFWKKVGKTKNFRKITKLTR